MSTGFENKKSKTKTSFAGSVDSFDITNKFQEYFTQITDPRAERTRYHLLILGSHFCSIDVVLCH